LCSLNSSETVILFPITGKASIEGIDSEESILFELPMPNIFVSGGEFFRLKKVKEVVEVVEEVSKWPSLKL